MAKKINLSKNEAFFEGFKTISMCDFDDNRRLSSWSLDSKGASLEIIDLTPCYTPKATLNSYAEFTRRTKGLPFSPDINKQYPNFASIVGYLCSSYNFTEKLEKDDGSFYLPRSINYYEKAFIKIFSTIYRFHYKIEVTGDDPNFGIYDSNSIIPYVSNTEFGGGLYKVEIEGHPEYTFACPFGSTLEYTLYYIEKGTYDLYIYSTLPTIDIDNDEFYCNNCTLTYLESEHLVQYVLTATDAGKAVISGYLGSIESVQADASVTVEGDAETNLFTLSFDRAGQYIVKLFCNESAEELRVQDSENCSFGNRTLVW